MRTSPARPVTRDEFSESDAVSNDVLERRNYLERQNRAFIEKLRAAIASGLETPAGVLGHEHGPPRRS
jgi:hypothetical protein